MKAPRKNKSGARQVLARAANKGRAKLQYKRNKRKHFPEVGHMTQRAAKQLKTLCATTRKYSSVVEKRLSRVSGAAAKEVFAESAAKYYPALKKLAAK